MGTIVWNFPIWHRKSRKSRLSMALGKFSIFWVQNFHFLSAEFWPVCLGHHCSFWLQNLHFLIAEFLYLSTEFQFLVHNLHFLSVEFWAVYLEQLLSAKFAFYECRILIFWARNLHFLSAEILEGLISLRGFNRSVYTVKPVFKTTWEIGTTLELRTVTSVPRHIQYIATDLRKKTTSEFRTVFHSPLGVPNSQVSLYIIWYL